MSLPTVTERHPAYWVALCAAHHQHPGDPDAFWNVEPARLERLVGAAKAEHGEDLVEVEVEDLGY